MAYRSIPALGNRPVLVRENHLKPGELVIVPESSEMIVVLAIEADDGDLATQLEWYVWSVHHHSVVHEIESAPPEEPPAFANEPAEPRAGAVIAGPQLRFDRPLLTQRSVDETFPLNAAQPWVQLGPILDDVDYSCLLTELRAAQWERREGEIYTQDSFDLLAWCRQRTASTHLIDVIRRLTSPEFLSQVARLTEVPFVSLRELYAYRLLPDERILIHGDGTDGGDLVLRMNLLIQAPENRPIDFRFWNPSYPERAPVVFGAVPNCAVFFLMGPETPHDILPVPTAATLPRLNLIMTFGNGPSIDTSLPA